MLHQDQTFLKYHFYVYSTYAGLQMIGRAPIRKLCSMSFMLQVTPRRVKHHHSNKSKTRSYKRNKIFEVLWRLIDSELMDHLQYRFGRSPDLHSAGSLEFNIAIPVAVSVYYKISLSVRRAWHVPWALIGNLTSRFNERGSFQFNP